MPFYTNLNLIHGSLKFPLRMERFRYYDELSKQSWEKYQAQQLRDKEELKQEFEENLRTQAELLLDQK